MTTTIRAEESGRHLDHLRTWSADGFRLDLWDTHKTDRLGKVILHYALYDETVGELGKVVFEGSDLACSPLHSIDGDSTVAAVLGFLSLQPGDTDSEFFEDYTPAQVAWCEDRAEDLQMLALELEEGEPC